MERMEGYLMLKKFFAVTTTSLYEVMARAEDGRPCVRKIDL